MPKYTKTVIVYDLLQLDDLTPGQWFKLGQYGARGQWYGKTRAGVDIVRYQSDMHPWGIKSDTARAKILRKYAKSKGAK